MPGQRYLWHGAPTVIMIFKDVRGISNPDLDCGIAGQNMALTAHSMGLGTCWVGWFKEQPVRELLGIPEALRVVAITPLGYPAQEPRPRPRKALQKIAFANTWGQPLEE